MNKTVHTSTQLQTKFSSAACRITGKLYEYLAEADTRAGEMFQELVQSFAQKENATEKLKS